MQTPRLQNLGCPLVVSLIAVAFGWPTRHGEFLSGDDQRLVTEHYLVNHPSASHAAELFTTTHGDLYQPLPMVSFQLDYARAESTPKERFPVSARPFHFTNIALHALNAILVYLLATRLAGCRRVGLLTGLMFACHPFAMEPVAWVNGRMMLLASLFSLLTICLCIRSAKSRPSESILATVAWVAAILSKIIPTVPFAAAICDFSTHGRLSRHKAPLYIVLLLLAVAGTYVALRATQHAGFVEGMQSEAVASAPVRTLLATRYYIENYVWPGRLAAWSPPPFDEVISSPPVLVAILEIILVASIAIALRRRMPVVTLGIMLFAILLAPLLAAGVARKFLAADRYMYLPIVGLHLALAAAAVAALDWIAARSSRLRGDLLVGMPTMLILAAWMSCSWHLAPTWASTVARDTRVTDVYPDSELAHAELAKAYNFEGDPDAALHAVEQARRSWPDSAPLAAAAGDAYRLKGDYENARRELEVAVERMPDHLLTRYRLGQVFKQLGERESARASFEHVLDLNADYFPALVAIAQMDESGGWRESAIKHYQRALAVNPHARDCRFNLSMLLVDDGKMDEATAGFETILESNRNDDAARLDLAVCLVRQYKFEDALRHYDILKANNPRHISILFNRAALLASMNRNDDAEAEFRNLLSMDPANLDAMIGLSEVLQRNRRHDEMLERWQTFLKTTNNASETWAWIAWSAALAGKIDVIGEAESHVDRPSTEDRILDWAIFFAGLRTGMADKKDAMSLMSGMRTDCSTHIREMGRSVLLAMAALPREIRMSDAGIYALAAAASDSDDHTTVRILADDVLPDVHDPQLKKLLTTIRDSGAFKSEDSRPPQRPTFQSEPR